MSEAEQSSTTRAIPPGWARIWSGAGLLMLAGLLNLALADSGGTEADGASVLLFLMIAAGFFGTVHLLIGCVMQGLALHEQSKLPTDQD